MTDDDQDFLVYVESEIPAELHPFDPAATEDSCLYRMAEGYICGSPEANPIHQDPSYRVASTHATCTGSAYPTGPQMC